MPAYTTAGLMVSTTTGLCQDHTREVAVMAVYWTDDAEFEGDEWWSSVQRFQALQQRVTDARAQCVTNCGRSSTLSARRVELLPPTCPMKISG
jgi:hypothetical protein